MVNYSINNVYESLESNHREVCKLVDLVERLDNKYGRIEEAISRIAQDVEDIKRKFDLLILLVHN